MSLLNVFLDPSEASSEVKDLRMEICNSCERKNSINICKECKCVVNLKVLFEVEKCPLKKW
jgi:hypothetical protein